MSVPEITSLRIEYQRLKKKLFGDSKFAVPDESPDWKRYDQLFQFFYPQFRTKNFKTPCTK